MPQPGVEVGNPDPTGKKITVLPQGRQEIYVLEFQSPPAVRVTEVLEGIYESQLSDFAEVDQGLAVSAQFAEEDGPVDFLLNLNELYEIIEVIFTFQGVSESAQFIEEDSSSPCVMGQADAATTLAQGVCSRIVSCNESFACDSCIAEVLEVPGLGQRFGGQSNSTLKENAQGIQNGNVTVDQANLQSCLMDMNIIPCPLVEEKFNDETVPNYNSVKELIPSPSCDKGVLKN